MLELHVAVERWEQETIDTLLASPVIHLDETSMRVDGKNRWVHVVSAGDRVLERFHPNRGLAAMPGPQLLEAVRQRLHADAGRLREERRAALPSSVATDVLDVVPLPARTAGALARRPEPMLSYEAIDANAKRQPLLQQVDQGTVCPC